MTDDDQLPESKHLSRIATNWTMVADAHDQSADRASATRRSLFERYAAASYRYLLGAVRDPEVAEDLCHEFAVRFLSGDFHRADRHRGRFRDYLKKVLANLVNDYHRSRQRWPRSLPDQVPAAESPVSIHATPSFDHCLREELLQQTWQALSRANATYHAVLSLRVENPEATSRELAEELGCRSGLRLTADSVRKSLERARSKFAELLTCEVAQLLDSPTPDDLRDELLQLDLLKYCRSALARNAS